MAGLTIIAAVAAPIFQEYVVAPVAVNVAEPIPLHMLDVFELTVGKALTVMVDVFALLQPHDVPVTV